MSSKNYDITVVGAGPAGVMAAWKAAASGCKTLLLEKEENPGRKVCAEGVLGEALKDAEVDPTDDFVTNRIIGAHLYAPDERKKVEVKWGGYILDKPRFLSFLAERARVSGAEVLYGAVVNDVLRTEGGVSISFKRGTDSLVVESRIVIGCDGVSSVLAKKYFDRGHYSVVAALQYEMAKCQIEDESMLQIFIGHQKAPAGYIWVFPKRNGEANVGIGMKGGNAKQMLDNFVSGHPDMFAEAIIQRSLAAPVPVGGEVGDYVRDNMMICGDAAGQVIPLTGAGIQTGIVAGKFAGEVAAEAIKDGDVSLKRLVKYR